MSRMFSTAYMNVSAPTPSASGWVTSIITRKNDPGQDDDGGSNCVIESPSSLASCAPPPQVTKCPPLATHILRTAD